MGFKSSIMLEIWIGFLATNIEKKGTDFQNLVWWIIFSRGTIIWDQGKKKFLSEDHRKYRKLIPIKIFLKNKIFQFPQPLVSIIKNEWFWKALGYRLLHPLGNSNLGRKKNHNKTIDVKAQKLSCVPRWQWLHSKVRTGQSPGIGSMRPVYILFSMYLAHSHLDTNLTPKCTCYMLPLFEDQNLCVHETFISRFHW